MDETQSTGWSEDRLLTAIADVEARSLREYKMLSSRIDRLEKQRGGSLGELDDISSQIGDLARTLLIGYGVFVLIRFFMVWAQQRQQQQP